jgi:hypothetical protein
MSSKNKTQQNLLNVTITPDQQSWLWCIAAVALTLWMLNWCLIGLKDTERGTIGDMFGVFNSLFAGIAFLGVLITVFMQRNQIRLQQLEIVEARRDAATEGFESRFYELVKLHRANLKEIHIAHTVEGRKAFVSMFKEFKFIYYAVLLCAESEKETNPQFVIPEKRDLVNIAYIWFFMGVGQTSDLLTSSLLKRYDQVFIARVLIYLTAMKNKWDTDKKLTVPSEDSKLFFTLDISYKPFGGHTSRLGHYYRHLFQTVKFITSQDENEVHNKYDYIKTLRAQLSNHEQLLLYYNSLSDFGTPWLTNGYFTNYLMIKNLPLPLANFGVLPHDLMGKKNSKGDFIFEWDETYGN